MGLASCANAHQGLRDRPQECPAEGSLAVLVTFYGVGVLVGTPDESETYVLVSEHAPAQRVSIGRIGELPAHTQWLVRPDDRGSAFFAGDDKAGIIVGPYAGPPSDLSLTCHTDWCRGEREVLAGGVWTHAFTIHRRGRPWLELFEWGDYSGVRTTQLRATPPCRPTVIATTKHYPFD
jgi:hypothetical protein